MVTAIYMVFLLACSFTLCIFGFFVGRCARKLPILDDNLPWAVHRSQIPGEECGARQRPNAELPAGTGQFLGDWPVTCEYVRGLEGSDVAGGAGVADRATGPRTVSITLSR